ncbi:MAG: hypothetical protein ABI970_13155, partial [Chloroflexota bacterium]
MVEGKISLIYPTPSPYISNVRRLTLLIAKTQGGEKMQNTCSRKLLLYQEKRFHRLGWCYFEIVLILSATPPQVMLASQYLQKPRGYDNKSAAFGVEALSDEAKI